MTRNERVIRIIVGSLILLGGVYLFYYTYTQTYIAQGMTPMDFPRVIFAVIIIAQLIDLIREIRGVVGTKTEEKGSAILPLKAIIAIASLFVYFLFLRVIGCFLSTLLYVAAVGKYLRPSRKWLEAILVGLLFSAVLCGIFMVGFKVSLPEPIFDNLQNFIKVGR